MEIREKPDRRKRTDRRRKTRNGRREYDPVAPPRNCPYCDGPYVESLSATGGLETFVCRTCTHQFVVMAPME
jgi:transcription elongation factor Elf1